MPPEPANPGDEAPEEAQAEPDQHEPGRSEPEQSPNASAREPRALLTVERATKVYGRIVACDAVSLAVDAGEIRGLLGQNGAGKSTLMKMVSGVVRPDGGRVLLDGSQLPPGDPIAALEAGIGMVHQHFSLVRALTVWENVALGERGRIRSAEAIDRVVEIGERYGLPIDPRARVEDLSPAQRQRVEIIKCLRQDPRLIILDEPTSVLTSQESRVLFDVLREMVNRRGCAVVLISHRLEEILRATDRVTVLRDGRAISTIATGTATAASLANEMLGREASLEDEGAAIGLVAVQERRDPGGTHEGPAEPADRAAASAAPSDAEEAVALQVENLSARGPDGRRLLEGLSLRVGRGEILGVAGVEGNGQDALVELLSGLLAPEAGRVMVSGREIPLGRPDPHSTIGVIPSDRRESGSVLDMTVAENLVLNQLDRVMRRGVIIPRLVRRRARQLVRQFDITAASMDAPMWSLSGGNQQRVVLARELSRNPAVLLAAQPTQGLDVGAIEDMWARLSNVARDGTAVLLISTELDEILALADRIDVIHRGTIVGSMDSAAVDHERLGLMMGGQAA